jgi:rubredoxin
MTCDHQWQESGTSKKHDWVCSKCKILYTVLKGLDDDDIQNYVRPWQGLTDSQHLKACQLAEAGNYLVAFQRIQEWLKESNT